LHIQLIQEVIRPLSTCKHSNDLSDVYVVLLMLTPCRLSVHSSVDDLWRVTNPSVLLPVVEQVSPEYVIVMLSVTQQASLSLLVRKVVTYASTL
jgi:hypothetical protein